MLLATLQCTGFVLRVKDDKLLVSPANRLDERQRAAVSREKASLIALLSVERDAETEEAAWKFANPGHDSWPGRFRWNTQDEEEREE